MEENRRPNWLHETLPEKNGFPWVYLVINLSSCLGFSKEIKKTFFTILLQPEIIKRIAFKIKVCLSSKVFYFSTQKNIVFGLIKQNSEIGVFRKGRFFRLMAVNFGVETARGIFSRNGDQSFWWGFPFFPSLLLEMVCSFLG